MKTATLSLLVLAALCAAPALAAAPAASGAAATAGQPATDAEAEPDRHCLRETGSRIRARSLRGRCSSAFAGRVWTRDDLMRTGEVDIADALRRLDPSIR